MGLYPQKPYGNLAVHLGDTGGEGSKGQTTANRNAYFKQEYQKRKQDKKQVCYNSARRL